MIIRYKRYRKENGSYDGLRTALSMFGNFFLQALLLLIVGLIADCASHIH
jgi:hypothetical protein